MQTTDFVAGPELDIEVATKVMGQKPPFGAEIHGNDIYFNLAPPYSTDISAAWQVVEHLRQRLDWSVTIEAKRKGGYSVRTDAILAFEADTAPLAICRAALAAVS